MRFLKERLAQGLVTLFRLSLVAWVGGAALFVITSVAEQTASSFDSRIRDQLATIRFPLYYAFGAALLGVACLTGVGAVVLSHGCLRKRMLAALLFTVLAAAGAALDYSLVYRPLQQMIDPPGQARSQQFVILHERSRQANEVHLGLALIAATCAVLPGKASLRLPCGGSCNGPA